MLNIKDGKVYRPQKVCIYGAEGVGKTSLAAQFPDPLFIDTEGGTSHLDVRRVDGLKTWEELMAAVNEVAKTPGLCKTLVIDTADWAEKMEIEYLLRKNKWASIETPGYGKGYQYCAEEFGRLLAALDKVIASGINVVITAHAKMRKFEQPDELGAYDRWEMKLTKQTGPLLKEWCDMLLFCNYKTFVLQSDNAMEKNKVQGGKRVMYTTHHPCWDAKNRHGLPDILDLDYAGIAHLFEDKPEQAESKQPDKQSDKQPDYIDKLRSMMEADGVTTEELQKVIADRGQYSIDTPITEYTEKFVNGWIVKYWDRILKLVAENRNIIE